MVATPAGRGRPISIMCRAPPGVGDGVTLAILLRGGRVIEWDDFSYAAPSLSEVSPSSFLSGAPGFESSLLVNGTNFGPNSDGLELEIGGRPCLQLAYLSH